MTTAMLIAARGDWVSYVFPIVFFLIYAISRLMTATKAKVPHVRNPPRKAPEGERPLRPPQAAPPANPPASSQSPLNAEIEQFLKRANKKHQERSRRESSPAGRTPKVPPKPSVERPIDVQPIERREFSSVSASVDKHLSNRTITQLAEHLGDDIGRADQEMEQHLQKAFSHRVGTLSDVQKPASATGPVTDTETAVVFGATSAANAIAGMLSDPKNLRNAVILNEILRRPDERWS
jgi:hypothetical protein